MLKDGGSFHPPRFVSTWLCESPIRSALAYEQAAAAQQITTCQRSCGKLGSCLPCILLVCPTCEVMPFSWKPDERSLNWNRLKTQMWAVTEVWLTYSSSLSPVHRLCVWTVELLAHKTWSIHHAHTHRLRCTASIFLEDGNPSESSLLPASFCPLRRMVIFLDSAERIDWSDHTKCVDDTVRCVYVHICCLATFSFPVILASNLAM